MATVSKEQLKLALLYHAYKSACILVAKEMGSKPSETIELILLKTLKDYAEQMSDPQMPETLDRHTNAVQNTIGAFVDALCSSDFGPEVESGFSYQEVNIGILWTMLVAAISTIDRDNEAILAELYRKAKSLKKEDLSAAAAVAGLALTKLMYEAE